MRFQLVTSTVLTAVVLFACAAGAQDFNEEFGLWPVDLKIAGTVIACGGDTAPESMLEAIAKAANQTKAKTVVIQFEGSNMDETFIKTKLDNPTELSLIVIKKGESIPLDAPIAKIESANVVWLIANSRLTQTQANLLSPILATAKTMVAQGGTLATNGEATEALGKFITEKTAGSTTVEASGDLLPDTVISSAYTDAVDRPALLATLAANPRCVGIGIESNTAIILQNRKIRAIGEGQATFCLMANEEKPLRVQHLKEVTSRRANPYTSIVDLTAWRRDAIERTVAPFPAKNPPTPFVENGTLFIVGGGGMPNGMMEDLVTLAGGENARMVYVPCSEADEIKGPQRTVEAWKKMGVQSATFIHTKDRIKANSDEEFLAPLKDATGIWFGGGRQWNFADSYYGTKAHRLMKDVLARGGVIGGSSAGASIQGAYMCRANPVANFDIMAPGYERGLGFIRGVAIDQHFSQRGRQKDMTQLVDRYPQLLGIGLDEATAIVVEKSKAKVIGRGKVHFYDRNVPVIPGTDDFIALQAGSTFDLAKRVVVKDAEDKETTPPKK